MGVTLGVGGVNAFRGAGTRSIEAYELFLRGEFERATQVDPNYAAAWAGYAVVVGSQMWINPPEEAQTILLSAHALALKATELDSESAQGYTYLATILYPMWDWTGAEVAYRKAQTLLKDRWTLEGHANMLMRTGRTTRAIEIYDAARAVEPLGGLRSHLSAYSVIAQQGFEEATEILKWADESWQRTFQLDIGLNKRDESLIKAALRDLISQPNTAGDFYANVLREFDSPTKTLAYLQETFANQEIQWPSKYHDISLFAAYFGNPEFALRAKAEEARYTPVRLGVLWYPMMSEMRQLPAFKELVTEINLVEYWRAYGWADACRPLGDNDFECR
jgi:tetratricopeptide (TPR) repeat protein